MIPFLTSKKAIYLIASLALVALFWMVKTHYINVGIKQCQAKIIPVYVKSGNARVVFNAHATDRKNLITCGKRLKAVVGWYVKRDNSVKTD